MWNHERKEGRIAGRHRQAGGWEKDFRGIHRFKLPWYFAPFGAVPEFIGHSGLSGALALYCPERRLFIGGTVNQVAHPDLSFRVMIKLAQAAA
jgi:hypothetical protein